MTFDQLEIIEPIFKALEEKGYTHPTPIQEQAIPILLEGNDLLGCAQTGTGKTAAFAIPILQNLYIDNYRAKSKGKRKIQALIVAPTRELSIQIADNFTLYGKHTNLKNTVIFGGVKQGAQTQALSKGVDILIATPGRLLDLISQGFITLKHVKYFVLDEADHMLDMGFIHDIKKLIVKLPKNRQSLFFSATMPPDIVKLSHQILGSPEKVTVKPEQATAEKVDQSLYHVPKKNKWKLLKHILKSESYETVLVFSRTKHGADKVVRILKKSNIKAAAIHGNKTQNARQKALKEFKSGELKVLVATDIAARGIDVSGLSMVINYDLPNIPETYVHRIGRTGRANASGVAISFCNIDEKPYLKDIQKLISQNIPVIEDHPFLDDGTELPATQVKSNYPQKKPKSNNKGGSGKGGSWRKKRYSKNSGSSSNAGKSRKNFSRSEKK